MIQTSLISMKNNTINQNEPLKIKIVDQPVKVEITNSAADRAVNGFHSALCLWIVFFSFIALISLLS